MKLRKISIENYKGFRQTEEIMFADGFNVVVGQNNSGKTALLEMASLRFLGKPHRSELTLPTKNTVLRSRASCYATIELSGGELKSILLGGRIPLHMPLPDQIGEPLEETRHALSHLNDIFRLDRIDITFELHALAGNWPELEIPAVPSPQIHGNFPDRTSYRAVFEGDPDRQHFIFRREAGSVDPNQWRPLINAFIPNIFAFKAERLVLGSSTFGRSAGLEPNARNLAEVLSNLNNTNPARFNRFNQYIRQIFPSLHRVATVAGETPQSLDIVTWMVDPETERSDLTIPLSESGTGIGQVLAILYVVITSDFPRVIIIDEPNSFLHPGASRKLIELLRHDFPQHQYIISTHSPETIRSADPDCLTLVRSSALGGKVEQLDGKHVHAIQAALTETGVRLSDVFGADQIMWVEGPTEEACIPQLLKGLKPPRLGISVLPVVNTGDFESRKLPLDRVVAIYQRLSSGNALVPPSVAFVFDAEGRRPSEIDDLVRRGNGKIHFLPRRMFENYLLDAEAIHAVLAECSQETYTGSKHDVEAWMSANGNLKPYVDAKGPQVIVGSPEWLGAVDSAKFLSELFTHFCGSALVFTKTLHSVAIFNWLLENRPEYLQELRDFIESKLPN